MGLGDVFTSTFSIFRRRIGAFLGLTALQQLITGVLLVGSMVVATGVVIGQLLSLDRLDSLDTASGVRIVVTSMGIMVAVIAGAALIAGAASLYFTGVMITCADEAMQQRFPTVSELRTLSKGFFSRYLLLYLAGVLLYGLGIALALLPMGLGMMRVLALASSGMSTSQVDDQMVAAVLGAVLLSWLLIALVAAAAFVVEVKLAYVMQVCALEKLSGMAALRRAWGITKEAFWRTLGYLLVFGLAAGAAQQVVSVASQGILGMVRVTMPSSSASQTSAREVMQMLQNGGLMAAVIGVYVVMVLVQLVIVPLKLVYVTVMYRDQVRRRELGPVAHAFGMNNVPGQPVYAGQPMPGYYGTPGQPPQYGQAPQYGQPPQYAPTPQYGQGYDPAQGGHPTAPGYGQPPTTTPYGQPTSYGQPPAPQG
jgi:hypothetical protein